MWTSCPQKYKLSYIDKKRKPAGIHAQFGTAMHSTMQHYLSVYYNVTKKAADEINIEKLLQQNLMEAVAKDSEKLPDGEFVCTRAEIEEFYWQGVEILRYFVRDANIRKLFQKKGYELVGIEVPVNIKIREGVSVIGFIDVILKDDLGNYIIIDLKTSTSGWSNWQKNDEVKKNQIILYKMWYSEQYNVPIDKIRVAFHIMKRIIPAETEANPWPNPRISTFVPPSGKIKQRQAIDDFMYFINEVFDANGKHIDKDYVKKPGKHCSWCDHHISNGGECDGIS